jgi:hypothetical protein
MQLHPSGDYGIGCAQPLDERSAGRAGVFAARLRAREAGAVEQQSANPSAGEERSAGAATRPRADNYDIVLWGYANQNAPTPSLP